MKKQIGINGFLISEAIYSKDEIESLINIIESSKKENDNFRQSKDLYAIRNLLQEIPDIIKIVLNDKMKELLALYFGEPYFPVKGIYFDKPPLSTWFVNWHQDLTISVDRKEQVFGFINWTIKAGQAAVQPSTKYLENILTARIHLDDTDEQNGGLHVIKGSHLQGIINESQLKFLREEEKSEICKVKSGGIMFMKPLLLHASYKSVNGNHRRVIHIEFTSKELPQGLKWREREII
ncbi:MAG TPA: phytanoyl-CoA dioxygenase family protein [Cytophagaceae bacterium]|jgi:ectoine hydroxylase-related dioxygenase (phytanoyl-CoA dioxygenase family)|nr:phytanoyl-CoA dioxygenase family protein [Cytophagaceae bacterium]